MNLLFKLHQIASERGDGLHPKFLELFTHVTCADEILRQPVSLKVVQPDATAATAPVPTDAVVANP